MDAVRDISGFKAAIGKGGPITLARGAEFKGDLRVRSGMNIQVEPGDGPWPILWGAVRGGDISKLVLRGLDIRPGPNRAGIAFGGINADLDLQVRVEDCKDGVVLESAGRTRLDVEVVDYRRWACRVISQHGPVRDLDLWAYVHSAAPGVQGHRGIAVEARKHACEDVTINGRVHDVRGSKGTMGGIAVLGDDGNPVRRVNIPTADISNADGGLYVIGAEDVTGDVWRVHSAGHQAQNGNVAFGLVDRAHVKTIISSDPAVGPWHKGREGHCFSTDGQPGVGGRGCTDVRVDLLLASGARAAPIDSDMMPSAAFAAYRTQSKISIGTLVATDCSTGVLMWEPRKSAQPLPLGVEVEHLVAVDLDAVFGWRGGGDQLRVGTLTTGGHIGTLYHPVTTSKLTDPEWRPVIGKPEPKPCPGMPQFFKDMRDALNEWEGH